MSTKLLDGFTRRAYAVSILCWADVWTTEFNIVTKNVNYCIRRIVSVTSAMTLANEYSISNKLSVSFTSACYTRGAKNFVLQTSNTILFCKKNCEVRLFVGRSHLLNSDFNLFTSSSAEKSFLERNKSKRNKAIMIMN